MLTLSNIGSRLLADGARVDDTGRIVNFGDPGAELNALNETAIVVPLAAGVIRVTGGDACSFLNAQLTSDVTAISPGRAQYSGHCTPKGRLLATMLIFQRAGAFCLLLPAALAQDTRAGLQRYVLRSKVTLADCSGELALFGVAGKQAAKALAACGLLRDPAAPVDFDVNETGDVTVVTLPGMRHLVVCPQEQSIDVWNQLRTRLLAAGADLWELQTIRAGIATVTADTREAFLPQMLALESYGAVSFDKGCYPGQEIVARTRYLGNVKRTLYRGHCDGPLTAGDAILSDDGKSAGMIANAATDGRGRWECLAVMQRDALQHTGAFTTGNGRVVHLSGPAVQPDRAPL